MRSIPLLAATTVIALGAWACGDGGGGTPPPDNQPPVAGFNEVCTQLSCVFTDASNDPDGNATIVSRSWAFGDNTTSIETSPTHAYTVAGTYTVVLTVTDDEGESDDFSKQVTVSTGTTANVPPTASFTPPVGCVAGAPCAFSSTSIDTDGNILSWNWNFGDAADPTAGTTADASHTYAAAGDYTVTLTVTDDDGAPGTITQTVTIDGGTTGTSCTTENVKTITCPLGITTASRVKITLQSVNCEIGSNRVFIPPPEPLAQTVFSNVCFAVPVGTVYTLRDEAGLELVVPAGTQVPLRFNQGVLDAGDPPASAPQGRIEGTFPRWTISIDDGGNTGGLGEPDFTDVVLLVEATP